jgi:hypothetical protein
MKWLGRGLVVGGAILIVALWVLFPKSLLACVALAAIVLFLARKRHTP